MKKEIILDYNKNQKSTMIRFYVKSGSKIQFVDEYNIIVNISIDDLCVFSNNISLLINNNVHLNIAEINIDGYKFRKIFITLENLTQEQYDEIDAGLA